MTRYIHVCQSVSGALKWWDRKTWASMAKENNMSVEAIKEQFRIYDLEGKRVIPIGELCEGFSYQTGCPGHVSPQTTDTDNMSQNPGINDIMGQMNEP